MERLLRIIVAIAVAIQLIGCKSQMIISNGAFSDISLARESKDYSLLRLKEVSSDGKANFGIPTQKSSSKTQGIIVRFNGFNVSDRNGFFPTLSMIGLSVGTGILINEIVGFRKEKVPGYAFKVETGNYILGFGISGIVAPVAVSSVIAIPVAGAINNLIWSGSAFKQAAFQTNTILMMENPGIDVFSNPKYEIKKQNNIWTQKVNIKLNALGATLKEDN